MKLSDGIHELFLTYILTFVAHFAQVLQTPDMQYFDLTLTTRQVCRRHVHNLTILKMFVKNVKILESGDYIWNHHEKCIKTSTNMPGIGLEIPEIAFEMSDFLRKSKGFCMAELMTAC